MSVLFERTLIIGASVSAAPTERNPAKRFLRSHGKLQGTLQHAFSGTPGARVLSSLKKSQIAAATAILAVDLMFWDSVIGLSEPQESRAYLRGFFKEVASRNLPVVIGRIPEIHALQIHRDELNEAIERECRAYGRARVLELDRLFDTVKRDLGVEIDGRRHRIEDLIPDGLHPGPVASEYVAREISVLVESLT